MNKRDKKEIQELIDHSIRVAFVEYQDTIPQVFSCPNCKHQTMAVEKREPSFIYFTSTFLWPGGITSTAHKVCLNCGKKFKLIVGKDSWEEFHPESLGAS